MTRRVSPAALALCCLLALAVPSAAQGGASSAGGVHQANATLTEGCVLLSGAGNGTAPGATTGNASSCMSPSTIAAPAGTRMVALTLANEAGEDVTLDLCRGGTVLWTVNGTSGTGTTGGACPATPGGSGAGNGTSGGNATATAGSSCVAPSSGGSGAGAANGTGNATTFPATVPAGSTRTLCIPVEAMATQTLVLADTRQVVGRLSVAPAGGNGTGTGTGADDNRSQESSSGNDTPAPGLLAAAAVLGLAALLMRRRR